MRCNRKKNNHRRISFVLFHLGRLFFCVDFIQLLNDIHCRSKANKCAIYTHASSDGGGIGQCFSLSWDDLSRQKALEKQPRNAQPHKQLKRYDNYALIIRFELFVCRPSPLRRHIVSLFLCVCKRCVSISFLSHLYRFLQLRFVVVLVFVVLKRCHVLWFCTFLVLPLLLSAHTLGLFFLLLLRWFSCSSFWRTYMKY